jgi:E3 ubiquitin-protein ligase TRIP12
LKSESGLRFTVDLRETTEDDLPLSPLALWTANLTEKMRLVLHILNSLHRRVPELPLEMAAFENRLAVSLTSPYLTVTCIASEIQIVQCFPFLFSFKLREFVLRTIGSDVLSGVRVRVFHERIIGKPLVESHNLLKCEIRRARLFEDGVRLLEKVGPTVLHFEMKFVGEEGSGIGPTREFFTLMAREFGLASREMWRNPGRNDPEYAVDPLGLFPHFRADPNLFSLLGLLCGKAAQMEYLVPLPINSAFFKLVKGERVEVAEVDPVYDMKIDGMEGMPFVYPGTEIEIEIEIEIKIEMTPDGTRIGVTAANFCEHKEKVDEFMCGSKVETCITAFHNTLTNVLKPNAWCLVDAKEMVSFLQVRRVR